MPYELRERKSRTNLALDAKTTDTLSSAAEQAKTAAVGLIEDADKVINGGGNGHAHAKPTSRKASPSKITAKGKKMTISDEQKILDFETHHSYEFGGPAGTLAMMIGFPLLMYYMWISLVFYQGKIVMPAAFDLKSVASFARTMAFLVRTHAAPTFKGLQIYGGLVVSQIVLALVVPGYQQEGLPVPSLNFQKLNYNCNALGCWYLTLIGAAGLHFSGLFRLSQIIDHFGEIMTVAIISGYALALWVYLYTISKGTAIRMSGNTIYDFFMGASLNPRLAGIDIKMWAEVRIPWILLAIIALAGVAKQYDTLGYVTPNQAFMVLAVGLYTNACAKGEECIPQTWDMAYEKFGFMLSFWNLAGVPFTYANSILYMASNHPSKYTFPLWGNILLYTTILAAYYVFDTSMSQKSRFKMQQDGTYRPRNTFPQLPWGTLKDPKYIQTAYGSKLLIDGWWAYARKPNYTADLVQSFTWAVCAGFGSPLPYFYPVFFLAVLTHRVSRDFERCHRKYGADWEEYCRIVPAKFIPGVF
ncbi:hypothetical protein E5Q_04169 [Mixia osmundae IAM 14324]|uniref:Delta(24(24(1)))-sterol reductase n=1 Tax=Mixia osmundae (strain CBS 9802 / IAM 14324 / JCM 22182 / KY 12970) TaxID=764103 RepID=G7E3T1_MIXOS|nr:hypothetical protein E5Q_04169 [Mixia osmundae IAM 14324]